MKINIINMMAFGFGIILSPNGFGGQTIVFWHPNCKFILVVVSWSNISVNVINFVQ